MWRFALTEIDGVDVFQQVFHASILFTCKCTGKKCSQMLPVCWYFMIPKYTGSIWHCWNTTYYSQMDAPSILVLHDPKYTGGIWHCWKYDVVFTGRCSQYTGTAWSQVYWECLALRVLSYNKLSVCFIPPPIMVDGVDVMTQVLFASILFTYWYFMLPSVLGKACSQAYLAYLLPTILGLFVPKYTGVFGTAQVSHSYS